MIQATRLIPSLSLEDKERFFEKISTTPTEKGCLEWMAGKSRGYGVFGIGGKLFYAHRVAYFLATGIDPRELLVCHTCDNPACAAMGHLFLGDHKDNNRDREQKGRGYHPCGDSHLYRIRPEIVPRGEIHWKARLSAADIPAIRADPRPHRLIAAEYAVSPANISQIKRRKTWAHI